MAQVEGTTTNRDRTKKEKEEEQQKPSSAVVAGAVAGASSALTSSSKSSSSASPGAGIASGAVAGVVGGAQAQTTDFWQKLYDNMTAAVPKLMDTAVVQETARIRGDDEKTIYEKIMSGDQTYIQYYDIKTGGLLSQASAVVAYADSDEADYSSAEVYNVINNVVNRLSTTGSILGESTQNDLLSSLSRILEQTDGYKAQINSNAWQSDADALIAGYENVQKLLDGGDAAEIVDYLRAVSDVVNRANDAAQYAGYIGDEQQWQAYIDGVNDRQQALVDIYNSIDFNPLNDTQLQELLAQKEGIEREKTVYYNKDGSVRELSTGAKILDALGIVDLQSSEEMISDLNGQLKTVNNAINRRLQDLGFSGIDSKQLYDAYQNDTIAELAREHPVLASALTVASNLGSALQTGDTVSAVFDGTKSTNEAYIAQKTSAILRSTAAQEFSEWYHEHPTVVSDIADKVVNKLGGDEADAGEFVYNILMSAADDLARTGIASALSYGLGGTGAAAQKVMKALSTLMASSSAMSSLFVDAIESGENAGDALLSSFIGAVAEGASEYLSVERLFKYGGKGIISDIIKTAVFEGAEEFESQIFENVLDMLVFQDESELVSRWNELKDEGNSNADVFKTIAEEELKEAGLNFLSGALSAGGTAIGTAPVTQAKTNAQNRAYGKAIIAAEAVPVLLEEAQSVPGVSAELRKTVSEQAGAEKQTASYATNVGKLFGEYSTAATQQAVQDRFVQLGFTNEQAQTAAEAIIKDMQGESLTKEQKKALKDTTVKEVRQELKDKKAAWMADTNIRLNSLFNRQDVQQKQTFTSETAEHTEPVVFSADGVEVTPQGVTQTADGEQQIVVDKASGATVQVQDLQPTDERSAAVQAVLANDAIGALGKSMLLDTLQLDGDSGDIKLWMEGYEEYYKAGLQGFNSAESYEKAVGSDDIGAYLTPDQKNMAVTAGLAEHQYTAGVSWITSGNVHVSETQETEAKILDAIGKEYGLAFVLTDNLDGVNGWYGKGTQSNRIVLSLDAEGGILTAAAGHEVFHYLKENAPDAANSLQKFVLQRLYSTKDFDINAELAKYSERYALEIDGMTETEQRQYLLEELTADSMFGVFSSKKAVELYSRKQPKDAKKVAKAISNFLAKVRSALETLAFKGLGSVSALQQQYDTLDEISRQFFAALEEARINRQLNKNTAGNDGVEIRYSKELSFETQVDAVINGTHNPRFDLYVSETPQYLQKLNFSNGPLLMRNGKLKEIIEKHNEMTYDIIKQIPDLLQNPILVLKSKTNPKDSVVVITEYMTNKGELIVPVWVGQEGNYIDVDVGEVQLITNFVATAYGRNVKGLLEYALQNDGFLFEGNSKVKVRQLFARNRLQLPTPLKLSDSDIIIQHTDNSVNSQFMQKNENDASSSGEQLSSKKLSSDTADYVSRLQQENEDLQAALEAAKAELHETRGLTITDKELRKISDFYADTLQSDLTREDLFKALRGYFNYAADGGDLNVVLGTMTDLYLEAMQTSHSEMLWTELYDSQKEVLDDLRTNPVYLSEIQVQTVESNFDGYKNFQRASFGKIRFVKNHNGNHATLDARWSELCDLSHGLLDPDTPDYAQPEALLDYYAATRPMWVDQGNPYGRTEQELADAAHSMALSTLMDYMNAPKYQTFADKAAARVRRVEIAAEESEKEWQKKYDAFKEKHFKELAEQREKYEQRLSDLREHRDTKLDEQKEYYLHRIDTIREKRHESDERNSLRRSVRRGAKRLGELLINETDQKHIPENLKAQISTFLELFTADDTTFTDNRLLALQAAYNEYGKDEELGTMFDEDIANKIGEMREALHGKRLTALNNSELQTLKELTQHFAKIVRDGNKVFYLGRKEAREEVGQRAVAAYTGEKPAQQIKMLKAAESLLHTNMLTPNSFFDLLEGPLAKCYEQLLFHDQDNFGRHILQGTNFLQEQKKKHGYNEWKDKKLTFISADGDEINLTADEVCMIYATWKREHTSAQQARHLEEGGIVFKNELGRKGKRKLKDRLFEVRDGSAHRLSVNDMEHISEFMTDDMRAFTDSLVGFLSKDASEWGNAVSMEKYGIKKFTEKYYIPFNTASNYNFRKFGTDIENGTNRLMNRSWTKHTEKGANTAIIVDNLTDVWSGHVAEMAQYSAFALTLDGMEQIFNYRTQVNGQVSRVSSLISTYYGQKYMDYFNTFMTDLNGKNYTDPRDEGLTKLIGRHKKAAVMLSLSVAVQQPTSYFRAFQELGVTSMFVAPGTKKTYEEMLEYAPGVTIIKEVGGFDSLVGKSMAGYIGQEHYTGKEVFRNLKDNKDYRTQSIDNLMGWIPGKLDQMTWQSIWKATKKQVAKETGFTGEALLTATGKRFTEIINDTQVYGSVLAQSHAMRSKSPLMKITTAFMAEPTVNYNMLLRLGRETRRGNHRKAGAILVSLVVSAIAQGVLKSLITASRDEDDEKTWTEKYLRDMVSELFNNLLPFNWVLILKDIVSFLKGFSLDRDEFAVITDILDAIADIRNDKMTVENKIQQLVSALSAVAGIPLGNLWKDLEMIIRPIDALRKGEENALEMTATSIGYAIAEDFSFYSSSVLAVLGISYDATTNKYYEKAFKALQKGDVQTYNDTLDYIRRKSNVDEDDIQNGIANQIAKFSDDAFFGALSLMVGDLDSHGEMVDALIDLGIEEETAVKGIEKVEANYKEMLEDAAKEELNGKTAQRDSVIADLTDILGDADSIEDLYAYTLEDVRNAPEEDDETLRVTASDIGTAVLNGRVDTTAEAIAYLREHGKSDSDIRSEVTKKVKGEYLAAYDADDYARMSQLIDDLFALGIGYDSSDFEDWEKDHTSDRFDADYGDALGDIVSARMNRDFAAYEAGMQALLDSDYEQDAVFSALNSAMADNGYTQKPETGYLYWYGDIKYALRDNDTKSANRMIDYMIEQGKEEGDIKSAITTAFKPDYVAAVNSGNTEEALQIADALLQTGLYEQKDLDRWLKN